MYKFSELHKYKNVTISENIGPDDHQDPPSPPTNQITIYVKAALFFKNILLVILHLR